MKFTVSTYDLRTFTSILWFSNTKCKNNIEHHFFIGDCVYSDMNDKDLIDLKILNNKEKIWLNNYHKKVFNSLKKIMNKVEILELTKACSAI